MKRRSLYSLGGGFEGPFDMLLGCHQRIRMFSELAQRVATEPAPAAEVAEAASRLCLYFGTALPLHEQDEEDTLVHAMSDVPGAAPLFARLRVEHRAIEAVLEGMLPRWEALKTAPERIVAEQASFAAGGRALVAAFAPHLEMEEGELYPLARGTLSEDALADMLRAMRERRAQVGDALTGLPPS